jgi:hypothetical protein
LTLGRLTLELGGQLLLLLLLLLLALIAGGHGNGDVLWRSPVRRSKRDRVVPRSCWREHLLFVLRCYRWFVRERLVDARAACFLTWGKRKTNLSTSPSQIVLKENVAVQQLIQFRSVSQSVSQSVGHRSRKIPLRLGKNFGDLYGRRFVWMLAPPCLHADHHGEGVHVAVYTQRQ